MSRCGEQCLPGLPRRLGATFALAVLLLGGCTAVPGRDAETIARAARAVASEPAETFVLLVHGSGSSPREWPADFIEAAQGGAPVKAELLADSNGTEPPVEWKVLAFDWEESAARRLTAPRRGYAIGLALGSETAAVEYARVVVVAHSVGAHLGQGFIDGFREEGGRAQLDAVFLDPFLPRGVLRWRWGESHFGLGSDRAVNYYVHDDGVPGTDRPIRHARNIDLTSEVPSRYWNQTGAPHYWVARYFAEVIGVGVIASGLQ